MSANRRTDRQTYTDTFVLRSKKSYSRALTQFRMILFDDLALTWWPNQATLTVRYAVSIKTYRTERALNIAEILLLCAAYSPGKNFELIITVKKLVKMETIHPGVRRGGTFGSEFPAIRNHCGVMTAWSRKNWRFCEHFCVFFGKERPLIVQFSKLCSESLYDDTDWCCCVQKS